MSIGSAARESTDRALEAAVRAYQRGPLAKAQRELDSFAAEPTVEAAVARAGLAVRYKGERLVVYDHQRRVPRRARQQARGALLKTDFSHCRTFHDLFLEVRNAIGSIPGIGDLTVYDTALRIGAKFGLQPDRVYIHAGTKIGARAIGLDWRAPWLLAKDLPLRLRSLPPWQVEDLLCIYKDHF